MSFRFVVLLRVRDDIGTDCDDVVGVVRGGVVQSTLSSLSLLNTRASASFHFGIGGSFRCGLFGCTGPVCVGAGGALGGVVGQSVLPSSPLLKIAVSLLPSRDLRDFPRRCLGLWLVCRRCW